MKNLILLSILSLCLCLVSCGDENAPVFNITTPSSGDTFLAGGNISIAGSVTDDVEVASVTLAVDGGILPVQAIDISTAPDKTNINLTGNGITLNDATAAGDYNIILTATDNEGNSTTESISIIIE